MYEWLLIILELVIFAATTSIYLLARHTAASAAAAQKSLDELLQELQATSEIVINDLNTRTATLRTLLEQADGRRHALESGVRPAPARAQAMQQQAPVKSTGQTKSVRASSRDRLADAPGGWDHTGGAPNPRGGGRGADVQRLAQEGMDAVQIAQQLKLTREEVHMILAGPLAGPLAGQWGNRSAL